MMKAIPIAKHDDDNNNNKNTEFTQLLLNFDSLALGSIILFMAGLEATLVYLALPCKAKATRLCFSRLFFQFSDKSIFLWVSRTIQPILSHWLYIIPQSKPN